MVFVRVPFNLFFCTEIPLCRGCISDEFRHFLIFEALICKPITVGLNSVGYLDIMALSLGQAALVTGAGSGIGE